MTQYKVGGLGRDKKKLMGTIQEENVILYDTCSSYCESV